MRFLVGGHRLGLSWAIAWVTFVATDSIILFTDKRWVGEFGWTIEWANGGLYFGGVLLAGITAAFGRVSLKGSSLEVLSLDMRGNLMIALTVFLRSVALAITGHATVVGAALIVSALAGASDRPQWTSLIYAFCLILFSCGLGVFFSALYPNIYGIVLAVGAAYLVAFNAALGLVRLPFIVGGNFVSMVGLTNSTTALSMYSILSVSFALVFLALTLAVLIGRRRNRRVLPAVMMLLALLLPTFLRVDLPDRIVVSSAEVQFKCSDARVQICLALGHTRKFNFVSDRMNRVMDVLTAAGVDLPTAFREELPGRRAPSGIGVLQLPGSYLNVASFSPLDFATAATRPRDCDAYYDGGEPGDTLLALSSQLSEWLAARTGASTQSLDPSVIKNDDEWAVDVYRSLSTCEVAD